MGVVLSKLLVVYNPCGPYYQTHKGHGIDVFQINHDKSIKLRKTLRIEEV